MRRKLAACFGLVALNLSASEVHVHDEGQVFISQEGSEWQVQFNIPALNAFGFEYEPSNAKEKAAIANFAEIIENSESAVVLDGRCTVSNLEHNFATEHEHHAENAHHDEHKHDDEHEHHDAHNHNDKHDHHDQHKHDDGHNHEEHGTHSNAEFTYHFKCASDVRTIDVRLFSTAKNLKVLEAMWITESGQGAKSLSVSSSKIDF